MANRTKYPLHDASGALVATHIRVDGPATLGDTTIAEGDKVVYWVGEDGKKGLSGDLADLPLYGIHLAGDAATVVVTEGEKAAQALIDAQIVAVGTVTGASATPSPRALGDLDGKDVILWPDHDEVGEEHMLRVAENLKGIAQSVWWVTWPDSRDHDDAADCIERHGHVRALDLLKAAGPVPEQGMRFSRRGLGYLAEFREGKVTLSFDRIRQRGGAIHGELVVRSGDSFAPADGHLLQGEFNASAMGTRSSIANELNKIAPRVKADWRDMLERFCVRVLQAEREGAPFTKVGGRPPREFVPYLLHPLLPLNRPSIIFGPGGSGKSYIAVACAVSVASGRQVLPGMEPPRKGRVLIVDWEADEDEWNDRINLVAAGAGITEQLDIDYRPGGATSIIEQAESLARFVADNGIDLIIIDSVGMASPGNREGSDANESTIRLMQALRAIGTTSLLIDHVRKPGSEGSSKGNTDPYGSVFKTNLARATWEMRRAEDEDEDERTGHVTLVNRKANNSAKKKPIGLAIEYGEGFVRFTRETVVDTQSSSIPIPNRVMEFLKVGRRKPSEIASTLGVAPDTMRPTLQRLVRSGAILAFPDGTYGLPQQRKESSGAA